MPPTKPFPTTWPYLWVYFYTLTLLSASVGTFTPQAHALCARAGYPQPPDKPLNTYVYLFAGCQFMLGLSLAVLEAAGEWRAVSLIIVCAFPMGVVGTTLSAVRNKEGVRGGAFWTHVCLMAVGTTAGWRLVGENW